MIRQRKRKRKGTETEDREMWPLQVRSSPRIAHVGKRKESSLWKTMALDRHTIASLEGSHYPVMRDRGEISEQTHSNDAHRRGLPTWRARASAVTKADFFFFVCNPMLLMLAVMGNGQIGKVGEGEKGVEREINGSSTTMLHPILIPCSLNVPLSTPFHSSDRRLQVVNSIAERGLVCEGELSCINKTNFKKK